MREMVRGVDRRGGEGGVRGKERGRSRIMNRKGRRVAGEQKHDKGKTGEGRGD